MIKKVIITNYLGESIELELGAPEKAGLFVRSIEGLGPGKANINTTDIATDDGSIFNSARSDQRNIVMTLGFLQADGVTKSIEDARHLTYKYFPKKKILNFHIITDDRELEITGYTESNEPNIFSEEETTQISIICPDPLFYSVGDKENETVFNGIDYEFEFQFENNTVGEEITAIPGMNPLDYEIVSELPPDMDANPDITYFLIDNFSIFGQFEFPFYNDSEYPTLVMGNIEDNAYYYREYRFLNNHWILVNTKLIFDPVIEMGAIQNLKDRNIHYEGDTETGVLINIHAIGPVGSINIYNTGTREVMSLDNDKLAALTGAGLSAGDDLTISTVKGNKYVHLLRNGREYNVLNILDKNADWFQLAKGDNVFTYTATSGSEYLQFSILNRVAFEGV